jgi:hypothetical protein
LARLVDEASPEQHNRVREAVRAGDINAADLASIESAALRVTMLRALVERQLYHQVSHYTRTFCRAVCGSATNLGSKATGQAFAASAGDLGSLHGPQAGSAVSAAIDALVQLMHGLCSDPSAEADYLGAAALAQGMEQLDGGGVERILRAALAADALDQAEKIAADDLDRRKQRLKEGKHSAAGPRATPMHPADPYALSRIVLRHCLQHARLWHRVNKQAHALAYTPTTSPTGQRTSVPGSTCGTPHPSAVGAAAHASTAALASLAPALAALVGSFDVRAEWQRREGVRADVASTMLRACAGTDGAAEGSEIPTDEADTTQLCLFGSAATGLSVPQSDCDLVLLLGQHADVVTPACVSQSRSLSLSLSLRALDKRQHARNNMPHTTCRIQHAACRIQHAAHNMPHVAHARSRARSLPLNPFLQLALSPVPPYSAKDGHTPTHTPRTHTDTRAGTQTQTRTRTHTGAQRSPCRCSSAPPKDSSAKARHMPQ